MKNKLLDEAFYNVGVKFSSYEDAENFRDEMKDKFNFPPTTSRHQIVHGTTDTGNSVFVESTDVEELYSRVLTEAHVSKWTDFFKWVGRNIMDGIMSLTITDFPKNPGASIDKCAEDIFYKMANTYCIFNDDGRVYLDEEGNEDWNGKPIVWVKVMGQEFDQSLYAFLLENVAKDFLKKIDKRFSFDLTSDLTPREYLEDVMKKVYTMAQDRLIEDKEKHERKTLSKEDKERSLRMKYGLKQ